jgi:putrescine transport system ATP-binding protein
MELASDTAGRLRAAQAAAGRPGDTVWVALRPEKIRISHERPAAAAENCVPGQVCNIGYLGDLSIYKVRLEGGFVMKAALANLTRLIERPVGADDRVWLSWPADAAVVLTT